MGFIKDKKYRRVGLVLGLSAALALTLLGLVLALGNNGEVSAKDKDKDKNKDGKTITIVAVTRPNSFQGLNPYPTKAQPGQELVAVTVDYDRDFKQHLRSSEAGEVYLSDSGGKTYYTVNTANEKSEGPGKKPARQVTFVFSVPQNTGKLTFHYGTGYTIGLP
jgi:hypothetical protein